MPSPPDSPTTPPPSFHSLQRQPVEPLIAEWTTSGVDQPDFHGRMAAQFHSLPGDGRRASDLRALVAAQKSASSMALSVRSHTQARSTVSGAPSMLTRASGDTYESSGVSTADASVVQGVRLLELGPDGILEVRPDARRSVLECPFHFLNCHFRSYDLEHWKTHTMWHFRGQDPPRSIECPLCDTFNYTYPNGFDAWDARMNHQAQHHYAGHTLATARPEFKLHHYLWQRRIISHAELQELKGASRLRHAQAEAYNAYTVTQGPGRNDRPQRMPRREGRG
ncbi:hypothetical protein W97_07166 [Coniosporium apollinis CBS 100218]|uniref:Uncharacterized protein n=1 Tax=Coniosporium apollinis (strain CBS 100218) TaxID=1168221 RepID=R7Z1U9_CONA1|nr:uncharacterized protein W97_07166 [Coniosporium apollinis CBS 100218]EON68019.1 hypothetical protein W97_07166 [Coniosporium apollinis CBS 100218]